MSEIIRQIESPEWESKTDLIKRTICAGATSDELDLFFYQARRAGLDPLARQIYYVKRKGKGTIQVGIDGFRLIADRTGKYAGSDDAEFIGTTDDGNPAKARVTVYKMVEGQRCPFTATARWDEYFPGPDQGFQWRKMPHTMLAKCAEALALRKAFPADLSGLYAEEEMHQAGAIDAEYREIDTSTGEINPANQRVEAMRSNLMNSQPTDEIPTVYEPTQAEIAQAEADWKAMLATLHKKGISYEGDGKKAVLSFLSKSPLHKGQPFVSSKDASPAIKAERRQSLQLWEEGKKKISALDTYLAQQGTLTV